MVVESFDMSLASEVLQPVDWKKKFATDGRLLVAYNALCKDRLSLQGRGITTRGREILVREIKNYENIFNVFREIGVYFGGEDGALNFGFEREYNQATDELWKKEDSSTVTQIIPEKAKVRIVDSGVEYIPEAGVKILSQKAKVKLI